MFRPTWLHILSNAYALRFQCICIAVRVAALPVGEQPRAGEPTESNSCDVIRPVPEALRLRHVMRPFGIAEAFYDKFTEAYGIPVVGECPEKRPTSWDMDKYSQRKIPQTKSPRTESPRTQSLFVSLEVFTVMRYTNLRCTYLLTYLLSGLFV